MRKGTKQQERNHRTVLGIKNGKMQTFCDTKLQTSVIGLGWAYKFRTISKVEVGELTNLSNQFSKAVHEAHRKFWASQGSMFRDKILVCATNANTKALKENSVYNVKGQYLLSLRDRRHLFTDLTELENHPLMQELIHTFDEALVHALDNYNLADMVLKEE